MLVEDDPNVLVARFHGDRQGCAVLLAVSRPRYIAMATTRTTKRGKHTKGTTLTMGRKHASSMQGL